MRREGMKRFLSLVLMICLIVGIVLGFGSTRSYAAVDDVDEYGHKTNIPDSFNEAEKEGINPYGKGAVNFSPVTELGIFQSDGNTVATLDSGERLKKKLFSTNSYFPFRMKDDFYSSAGISKSASNYGSDLKWTGGVAADLTGTGRKDYSVYYGFHKSSGKPQLSFYHQGDDNEYTVNFEGNYGWMNSGDFTYDIASGYNSIAAGDFNNDGKETVVFYDPAQGNLSLKEYQMRSQVSVYEIGEDTTIAGFYGKTLNAIQGFASGKEAFNTARVNLTAANVDGKDGDELIATVSLGNLYGESGLRDRSSVVLVLKKSEAGWKIAYVKQMSSVVVSGKNNDHSHDGTNGWYMRSASSDIGDVDGDGALEIVTVGTLADDRSHNDDDIRTDGTVAVITECGGSFRTQTNGSGIQGYFLARAAVGGDYVGYASDKYAQMGPVSLACAQFDGIGTQEYIVVRGEIFYLDGNGFKTIANTQFQCCILNNVWGIYRPVVGNFDNNTQGREQIFWIQVRNKKETDLQIAGYYYSGNTSLKDNSGALRSCRYGVPGKKVKYGDFVALTAVDADTDDGMIVKYNSQQYTYADPEVMAILEAAPYFSDVADNVGYYDSTGSTSFGVSHGSSSSSSSSSATRAGAYMSFEQDFSFFGVKIASVEAEASYQAEWSSEVSMETSYTYEMVFNGHQEDNSVVLIYTPVIIYSYDVWNNNTKCWEEKSMDISIAQKPEYKILTVDDYNEAAAVRNDPQIGEDILPSTPGRPETYRQDEAGLNNPVSATETYVQIGEGSGSVQSTVTAETSQSVTNSFTHSFDAKAGAGAGGVTIGASAGYSSSKATTETNTEGVIRSGTVADVPKGCGNYSFQYKFASWDTTFQTGTNTYKVPVLGYVVKNVIQPPHLPVNVNAVSYSNRIDLDWEKGPIAAKTYEIYRYSEAELGGIQYFRVGTVDGSEDPLAFTHDNLEEGTLYEYSFRSVGADGSKSVYSKPQPVMTTASTGAPVIIAQPGDRHVLPGTEATFRIIAVPADTNGALNFAWQKKEEKSSSWYNIKGAERSTYTIPAEDVTLGMDGTSYRCLVSDWGNKQKPVFLYSKAATLHVGLADSTVALQLNKDHGYADYVVTETEDREETVTVNYQITVGSGEDKETIHCEKYADPTGRDIYYCLDDNKYYSFTDLVESENNENGSQNRQAMAAAKQEWEQLDSYLIADDGEILGDTSNLDSEVPVTEDIDGDTYEVWTATGVIDKEEETLTLYRGTQGNHSDKFFYLKETETDEETVTTELIEMTGKDSYGNLSDDAKKNTYLTDTLSHSKAEQAEDGYNLYDFNLSENQILRLYEKVEEEGIYYTKTILQDENEEDTISYERYGQIYKGYLGQITVQKGTRTVDLEDLTQLAATPETTVITVQDEISTAHGGEAVQLTARVSSDGTHTGRVTFNIVNTTTGDQRVIRTTTDEAGVASVTWTPATAGVYRITADFAGSNTAKPTSSEAGIYYARENENTETGYDLNLPAEVPYGDAFTPMLYSWNLSDGTLQKTERLLPTGYVWKVYAQIGTGEDADQNGFSNTAIAGWTTRDTSLLPGYYMVTAENESGNRLVSKCLTVRKRKIILAAPNNVSVDVNNLAKFDLAEYVPEITIENEDGSPYVLDESYKELLGLSSNVNKESPIAGEYDINVTYVENDNLSSRKEEFLKRYVPEWKKGSLNVTTSLYTVKYQAGQNGTLSGFNASADSSGFQNGRVIVAGSKLIFHAKPDPGFKVDLWTVKVKENNQLKEIALSDTEGYQLTSDHTVLEVDSLSGELEVSVSFVNQNYDVSFGAGDHGSLSAKQGTESIFSGTKIAGTSAVEFTATPAEGYVVTEWTVKQGDGRPVVRKNADGSVYVKNTLIVDNILSNIDVNVKFGQKERYQVTYEAMDYSGVSPTGITFSSEGLDEAGTAAKGAEVILKAELKPGVAIREWQTSTDGKNWITKAKSQNTFTIDNLQSDLQVRVIINNTSTTQFDVQYRICDEDGTEITDGSAGTIKAESNKITINPGYNVAYIPIDFTFTEEEDYEVVRWIVNGETSEALTGYDVTTYYIDQLSEDTTVQVIVRRKPTVPAILSAYGTANVAYKLNGKEVRPSEKGYVYSGTELVISVTPDDGYRVKQWLLDEDIYTKDNLIYTENKITVPVGQVHTIAVEYVQKGDKTTVEVGAHGSLASAVVGDVDQTKNIRKGIVLKTGVSVKITVAPDTGYRVKEWSVNNEPVRAADGRICKDNTYIYTATNNSEAIIRVVFEQIDYSVCWNTSDSNGTVTAGSEEVSKYEGFKADIQGGTEVIFTAKPSEGYLLDSWTINGKKVTETTEGAAVEGNILTWTVPSGAMLDPQVTAYEVEAIFVKEIHFYDVTFEQPENGTLRVKANGTFIDSPQKVKEGTTVTFTVQPEAGYQVIRWQENDQIKDSSSTTYSSTVNADTKISVTLVKASYTVKYGAAPEGTGTISVSGGNNGKVSAGYGKNVTFTATPNQYYHVKEWKVDGSSVKAGVSEDRLNFTLSNVTADHQIEAVLEKAISYEVNYSVSEASSSMGSLSATINDKTLETPDQTEYVDIDSRLTFTATPKTKIGSSDDRYMVKRWIVNGETAENNLSKTFTIGSLLEATDVTVEFEQYVGFDIPSGVLSSSDPSASGTCEVKDVKRVPDDTSPKEEIRRDGNLTFTMKPEEGKMFDTLFVYGVDCLKAESGQRITVEVSGEEASETDSPSAKLMAADIAGSGTASVVTVTKNKDDSYTISIENVQQDFNPEFTTKDKPIDVKGAKISVAGGESFVYNGKAQVPKQINVAVDGKTLTPEDYEVTCKNNVNAGTATITVAGKNRYTGTATGSFVIQKRKLTVVADHLHKLYGDADPILTYNVQGLLNEDKVDVRLTRQPGENPGQYEILAEAAEKENYQISCQKGTFTIIDFKNPALKNALNKTFNISWNSGNIKVKFGKVLVADGYDIFAEQCTKEFGKKPIASLANTKKKVTIKAISGRKLNQRKCYKVVVKAYRLVDGKKEYIATSEDLHIAGKKSRWTNAKKVTVKKKTVNLAVGKKAKIVAKVTKESRRKKLLYKGHAPLYRYWSTDKNVATVTAGGVIKANRQGRCDVYVMTANGKKAKVKVEVK